MILFNQTSGIVEYDGPVATFAGVDTYRHPEVTAEFEIRLTDAEKLDVFRDKISSTAGDSQKLQGSIADSSQITMLALGRLLEQLKAGTAIDEIIASDPAFALCIEFSQAETAGTMKMPFKVKPDGDALKDIIHRTNAVAELYV